MSLATGDDVGPIVCEVFVSILEELETMWPHVKRDGMLVGSAPLAIRGLRDVKDLDIVATEEAFRSLEQSIAPDVARFDRTRSLTRYTAFGQVQIAPTLAMHAAGVPLSTEKAWVGAEQWNGWRVLSREDCLLIKRTLKREKDEEDVRLLLHWDPRRVLGLDGRVRIDRTGMTEVVEMARPLPGRLYNSYGRRSRRSSRPTRS